MPVACYNLHERLMPVLRAEAARGLRARGLRQDRIAEHLGVSQAMVSKYLRSPPRSAAGVAPKLLSRLVDGSVQRTMSDEGEGRLAPHCSICVTMSQAGLYLSRGTLAEDDRCLRTAGPTEGRDRAAALERLRAAELQLRRLDLRPLQPAVRINMATTRESPSDVRDVASFPGRLVDIRGRIQAVSGPEFGASTHLSGLLLRIRRRRPEIRSILNLRYDARIRRAAEAAGLALRSMRRSHGELVPRVPARGPIDGIVDPGAFGVEPILYLLGRRPRELVEKAARIRARIQSKVN